MIKIKTKFIKWEIDYLMTPISKSQLTDRTGLKSVTPNLEGLCSIQLSQRSIKVYFGIGSGTNLRTWLFCAFRSDHHSITDMTSQRLAEDEWFEHSVAYFIHDGFQDRSIKPLWQSSVYKIYWWRDLNPHVSLRLLLRQLRLPFRHISINWRRWKDSNSQPLDP